MKVLRSKKNDILMIMRKIFFKNQEFDISKLVYPILIHGQEGAGASLYTVSLAANLYLQNNRIIFLCGYTMAEKEFTEQVGTVDKSNIQFFVKEKVEDFKDALSHADDNTIIVVKNIEEFEEEVFQLVCSHNKIIISGDIYNSVFKDKILANHFATRIFFSSIDSFNIPEMNKYEGYLISATADGITKIE